MILKKFFVNFQDTKLVGDIFYSSGNVNTHVLFLHGAGESNRLWFDNIRKILSKKNITTYSFDFIGYGETVGDIKKTSLESRVKQSLSVIASEKIDYKLSIIASSMSGYVAMKLTQFYKIENLILLAPAVYDSSAYSVTFGLKFTEIIRKPYSWKNSDIWEINKKFKGNFLLLVAEKDQIIPREITEKIYSSIINAKTKKMIVVNNANHSLVRWLNNNLNYLDSVSEIICNILEKTYFT